MTGIERIAAERQRQLDEEGWSLERDAELYPSGELARAAAAYALRDTSVWPWSGDWWKPGDRMRELEKAGALIAAEIDRLLAVEAERD